MSNELTVDRRSFVAGFVGVAGLLLLPTNRSAIKSDAAASISIIVNPEIEAAAAFGAAFSHRGGRFHSLHGDRYRSMRSLLNAAETPITVAGVGTYADFVVVTGVLREARYDLVSHGVHPLSNSTYHRCFGQWAGCEAALIESAAAWPVTLANVVAGHVAWGNPVHRSLANQESDSGTVLSWVTRSRCTRRIT